MPQLYSYKDECKQTKEEWKQTKEECKQIKEEWKQTKEEMKLYSASLLIVFNVKGIPDV